ncbi:ABC transporter ATP-binding protein [Candidatus Peregrinibacteria bacterium]|nr:MAG: ABC transporter ATP-binding protein [Candidatus Peregrinibacteria bacterium]
MLALVFENVRKEYKDLTALSSVSFSVKEGEFFALLGQNGAGKTTLISCLAGTAWRSSGSILVQGEDPEKNPNFTKAHLGIVPQEITFDPFFSPLEALRMRRGFFGLRKNDTYLFWLLEKLSLFDKKDVEPRWLSGGMKRRLMIAFALAHEPRVLILDEPTAGVDVELRKSLWIFLEELRKEKGITILLTTHYLEEAEALADRIAILHKGSVLVCEEKKKLLSRRKRVLEIETNSGEIKTFEMEKEDNIVEKIQSCPSIRDIRIREPKLEEVFLEMTQS